MEADPIETREIWRRGTDHVPISSMRNLTLSALVGCVVALTACDMRQVPTYATVANTGTGTTTLSIIPSRVQLVIGTTAQLTTNAPAGQDTQIQWASRQPAVAAVSPSGLVTALAPGTATIVARFSFDTTVVGTATVAVTP